MARRVNREHAAALLAQAREHGRERGGGGADAVQHDDGRQIALAGRVIEVHAGRGRLDEPALDAAADEHGARHALEDRQDDHAAFDIMKAAPCAAPVRICQALRPMAQGALVCRSCGAELGGRARFCAECGLPVAAATPTSLARTEPASTPPPPEREITPAPSSIPLMRIPMGTVLSGAYVISGVLGEGGMGVVYRAHDKVLGRTVAIKCLHSNLAGDAEIRRRFVREARVLRTFSHPNVVSIFDLIEHEHLLGIVMEHVDGPSLAHHIAKWRGRMPFEEIRAIFSAVLEAMDAAHRQGIVHRDLKPDNVLVARGPRASRPRRSSTSASRRSSRARRTP